MKTINKFLVYITHVENNLVLYVFIQHKVIFQVK